MSCIVLFLLIIFSQGSLKSQTYPDSLQTLGRWDSVIWYHLNREEFETAESLIHLYVSFTKEKYGKTSFEYLKSIDFLQGAYFSWGFYEKALPVAYEIAELHQKLIEKDTLDHILDLHNLSTIYKNLGDFERAEEYSIESIQACQEIMGKDDQLNAIFMTNLAEIYIQPGLYGKAETILLEALAINERAKIAYTREFKANGNPQDTTDRNVHFAKNLDLLASIQLILGKYELAQEYVEKSTQLNQNFFGTEHSTYAKAMDMSSTIQIRLGKFDEAKKYAEEALKVNEKIFGSRHHFFANSLQKLAGIYFLMNNPHKADSLIKQAIEIYRTSLSQDNYHFQSAVILQAEIYTALGQIGQAIATYSTVLDQKIISNPHTLYSEALLERGKIYWQTDKPEMAIRDLLVLDSLLINNITHIYPYLSEAEQLFYRNNHLIKSIRTLNSFLLHYAHSYPELAEKAFDLTLATKGLSLSTNRKIRQVFMEANDSVVLSLYDHWRFLRKQISDLSVLENEELDKHENSITSLQLKADKIEKRLHTYALNLGDLTTSDPYKWQDVMASLGEHEAAISFLRVPCFNGLTWTDSVFYCALVVRPQDTHPHLVRLCEEYQLKPLIRPQSGIPGYISDPRKREQLFQLVWAPFTSLLNGVKTLHLAPDGLLHNLSFEALANKGTAMIDQYSFHYYGSLRDFIHQNQSFVPSLGATIALVGGADFDLNIKQEGSNEAEYISSGKEKGFTIDYSDYFPTVNRGNHSGLSRRSGYPKLEATKKEVRKIGKIFKKHRWKPLIYTEEEATESNLRQLSGENAPAILHIATHGSYFPPSKSDHSIVYENPLFRSVLALAGANQTLNGETQSEDGIFSAYEVVNMDLRNTDLVVLSACQTGLGDIIEGEGIIGLRRAFKLSGVNSLIISLWEVNDKETRIFMERFYKYYLKGIGKYTALRLTKQKLRKQYPTSDNWAAFVLIE
ncbi:MAG: CHAT domain-containing tetratricopeptide repeat protein [Bacteroidia bacterium]